MKKALNILILILSISCNNIHTSNTKIASSDSINHVDSISTSVTIDTFKFIDNNKQAGNYYFASLVKLDSSDLKDISPKELRLIRNEIFARHGYIFKSPDLKEYFGKQEWYKAFFIDIDKYLTQIERFNIKLLNEYEKKAPDISKKKQFENFVQYIIENKPKPTILAFIYGETPFDCCYPGGFNSVDRILFKNTKTNIYLLYRFFNGCDACPNDWTIRKFNTNGELINEYKLGKSNEDDLKEINTKTIIFKLKYFNTMFDFEDTTNIASRDTSYVLIKWKISINNNEELILNEIK